MELPIPRPAYSLRSPRLLIRCYEPTDSEALAQAGRENREHLLPWMPWAQDEPQTIPQKADLIRGFRGNFDLGRDFIFAAFEPGGARIIGGTGLHPRCGPGGLEIGYWVDREHVGRGYATEMASAMCRLGIECYGAKRIEIRCAPDNHPSMAIPRKLGFEEEGLLRERFPWPDGSLRDTVVFSLLARDHPKHASADMQLEVYDVIGERIL